MFQYPRLPGFLVFVGGALHQRIVIRIHGNILRFVFRDGDFVIILEGEIRNPEISFGNGLTLPVQGAVRIKMGDGGYKRRSNRKDLSTNHFRLHLHLFAPPPFFKIEVAW